MVCSVLPKTIGHILADIPCLTKTLDSACMIVPYDCTDDSLICRLEVFDRRSRKYYAAGNIKKIDDSFCTMS